MHLRTQGKQAVTSDDETDVVGVSGVRTAASVLVMLAFVAGACGGQPAKQAGGVASASAAKGRTYSTKAFVVPFDVTVPSWLPARVTTDSPHFVTWEPTASEEPAVRVLEPVAVYQPGDTEATPPPEDYLSYLLAQSKQGASFTDSTTTTVDGLPTTIVTATTHDNLDGSLGCAAADLSADDCFGLQSELALRIAVIDAGDHTLLIWLRHHGAADTADASRDFDSFARMLSTIKFREAPPTAATATSGASSIDGTWKTSITKAELTNSPLLEDPEEINEENYGDFTFRFAHGRFKLTQTTPPHTSISGTFAVDGDAVRLDLGSGERFDLRYSVKGDELVFTRDDALGVAPTPLVLHPWTRA